MRFIVFSDVDGYFVLVSRDDCWFNIFLSFAKMEDSVEKENNGADSSCVSSSDEEGEMMDVTTDSGTFALCDGVDRIIEIGALCKSLNAFSL